VATVTINRRAVAAHLDQQIKKAVIAEVSRFERILQEEFRKPKTGRVYGEETAVEFKAKGGGEKDVSFGTLQEVRSKSSRTQVFKHKAVTFTANKGQKASKHLVKFVATRGKKWREGKSNRGMHRASKAGEAPALQTGALRKGITHVIQKVAEFKWLASTGVSKQSGRGAPTKSGRSIAHMLEWGTTRMKARPGFRLALARFKAGARRSGAGGSGR
jgi:hypothetical protein